MQTIRKWLAFALTSLVLVGVPLAQNVAPAATATASTQAHYQLACSGGGSCGSCC